MSAPLPPLTILEEFLLLALDPEAGEFYNLPRSTMDAVSAGAVLMDLSLAGRIDNDLHTVFTVDPTPTGDDLLDPWLRVISMAPVLQPHPIADELRSLMEDAEAIRKQALRRLQQRGMIGRDEEKILWIFDVENFPILDSAGEKLIKDRILNIITHADIVPTPKDVMIIALADSCGLLHDFLPDEAYNRAAPRIRAISRMEIICQAVAKAVDSIDAAIAMASGFH